LPCRLCVSLSHKLAWVCVSQYSSADGALDQGASEGVASTKPFGRRRTIAFDDLQSDLDDSDFYGNGGGLRHGYVCEFC